MFKARVLHAPYFYLQVKVGRREGARSCYYDPASSPGALPGMRMGPVRSGGAVSFRDI